MFGDFIDRICPIQPQIKDITNSNRSAPYLDLHLDLKIDSKN
jgi:hypothetical protein